MTITDVVNVIINNGIGVGCVVFLINFINTTMKENNDVLKKMQETQVAIQTTLVNLTSRIDKIEDKIKRGE